MRRLRTPTLATWCVMMTSAVGCNVIGPTMYIMQADRTRKVQAEYGDLAGKTVCICVWADDAIVFDYPQICLDVANHAKFALGEHIKCEFVDPVAVDSFQRSDYHADQLSVVQIGKRFGADVVLSIQVVEFRTRPVASASLFQGLISTSCALYDCKGDLPVHSKARGLWSGQIKITYPETRPLSMTDADDLSMRAATLQVFGQALAKKFYTHREPIQG